MAEAAFTHTQFSRASALRHLRTPCVVKRAGAGLNPDGEPISTLQTVFSSRCNMMPSTSRSVQQTANFQQFSQTDWIILMPWDDDVEPGDFVVAKGMSFEVTGSDKGSTDLVVQMVQAHLVTEGT